MKTVFVMCVLALAACKKSEAPAPAPSERSAPPPVAAAPVATDQVEVLARHRPPASQEDLDADPVVVHFDRFRVTKASFTDPQNLEGASATLELDLASVRTGSTERDEDLKSPAYFDVGKFATATIVVANVKKQADGTYTADASVAMHGESKTYPVKFAVLATTADSVRIRGEHVFSRLDFGVGVDPAKDPTDRIATELTIRMTLTIQRQP